MRSRSRVRKNEILPLERDQDCQMNKLGENKVRLVRVRLG